MTLRSLEIEGLKADLVAVQRILDAIGQRKSIVSKLQFESKRDALMERIKELESKPSSQASVGLFFSGQPVIGSSGIYTAFAGSALSDFQSVFTNYFAVKRSESVGERGPLVGVDPSKLMITSIARGSFGFVLDEFSAEQEMFDSPIKAVLSETLHIISDISEISGEKISDILSRINKRTLSSLNRFYTTLAENSAVIRIADDERVFVLDSEAIRRGKLRTEQADIEESYIEVYGILSGMMTDNEKFSLRVSDDEKYSGKVSPLALSQFNIDPMLMTKRKVRIQIQKVSTGTGEPKEYYTLSEILSDT